MKIFSLSVIFVAILCLAACNTVEGLGKDLQYGGAAISNSANKNDNYSPKQNTEVKEGKDVN